MVKALVLAAILALTACQTMNGDFCTLAKPIRLTPEQVDALTDDQVRQYLGHNERGRKQCGWRQ